MGVTVVILMARACRALDPIALNHTFFNTGADGHAKRPDSAGSSEAASFTVSQHGKNELYSTGTTEELEMQLIWRRHNCGQVESSR